MRLLLIILFCLQSFGATYYVGTGGSDGAAGSVGAPFLTIQKGVDTAVGGDTVYVNSGLFPERWNSARNGVTTPIYVTGHSSTNWGYYSTHSNIVVQGFSFERFRAGNNQTTGSSVRIAGRYNICASNIFSNPIAVLTNDVTFNNVNPDTITSATADFVAAGFVAGTYLIVERAYNTTAVLNEGSYLLIGSVTASTITMDNAVALTAGGPVSAYINGSHAFSLNIESTATNCTILSNTFYRVGARCTLIAGQYAQILTNQYIECGHDIWSINAGYLTIRGNYIRGTLMNGFSDPSPDIWEKWTTVDKPSIDLSYNWIQDWLGGIALHDDLNASMDIHHNVFVGCAGSIYPNVKNMLVRNNTFISVATQNYAQAGGYRQCLEFQDGSATPPGPDYGTLIAYNNIFALSGQVSATNGYYQPTAGFSQTYVATNNYVAGPTQWAVKSGWPEASSLNGGDPGFVGGSSTNYLGSDGIPFTSDDNLYLTSVSILRGTGYGGIDIGAHGYTASASTSTTVSGTVTTSGTVTIR